MAGQTNPFQVTRKRFGSDPSNRPGVPEVVPTLSVVATKLRVTLPRPVSVAGIPQYAATGGAHTGTAYPTAVEIVSPTVVDLDYAAIVAAADVITIPGRDPAIRFQNGAYVAATVKTL